MASSGAPNYTATDAAAYERLMGRWSGALADKLIAFAGLAQGERVLDIGCGTGSLALALASRPEPAAIVGIDIAAPYIEHARQRSSDPRLSFAVGNALALDFSMRRHSTALFPRSRSTSCAIRPKRSPRCGA